MGQISLSRSCRPVRLGFIVRPGHRDDIRKAVEINTVLWGGTYNPLIPLYARVPPLWKDKHLGGPTAVEVVRGYVSTFQPDFLVKPKGVEIPAGILPKERVITTVGVLSPPDPQEFGALRSPICFGVDIMDVYADAYRKVFRFVRRHPHESLIPIVRGRASLFAACLWGAFPIADRLPDYPAHFADAFEAKTKSFRSLESLLPKVLTPLTLTTYKLESSVDTPEPCAFVLDEQNSLDLIDFWNLRACGGSCVPVPASCIKQLDSEILEFMDGFSRKRAVNTEKLSYPWVICSRTLGWNRCAEIAKQLPLSKEKELILAHYPRLWEEQEASWDGFRPTSSYYEAKSDTVSVQGEHLVFDQLDPEFVSKFGRPGPRWMNVVSMHEYGPCGLPANVIPDGFSRVDRVLKMASLRGAWTTDGGIAVCCEHKNSRHYWTVPDAVRIGEQWASEHGYKCELSDAGHILQSMTNVAGGLAYGSWFADEGIIKALGRMASGVVSVGEFRQRVKEARDKDPSSLSTVERCLQYFQDRGIICLCMKVQCPHCRQHPWYTLEELGHELRCRHCLRSFRFPAASPPKGGWCYRSTGPFASADFGQGAYSAFLSMRFLNEPLDARTTCVPSCKLVGNGSELEADLICFWQRPSWRDRGQHIIVGECKCFSDFEDKDVLRMREIVAKLPGTIIAFCTLKPSLTKRERSLLRTLAMSGRRPTKGLVWPTPVLVLTGNELCTTSSSPFQYRFRDENMSGLARRMPGGDTTILDLCSASQEEYLGLMSWHSWLQEYYRKRAKKKSMT